MVSVGILGNGTVGSGVVELLKQNYQRIKEKTGQEIKVSKVLVKDFNKHINSNYARIITNNISDMYLDKMDIVVEVMGGIQPAYDYIKHFLRNGKHVITANKDLMSLHGEELMSIANENRVRLKFGASVGGGIPVIESLENLLCSNEINSITGILNGTTNYILSKMYNDNLSYAEALELAKIHGFAEANPDGDVLGYDAARKLAILLNLSYDECFNWQDFYVEGINNIDIADIENAKRLNCKIKLLAMSKSSGEKMWACVRPALVSINSEYGRIDNEFNGVLIEGNSIGEIFLSGKGAGKFPTATSVIGDIIDVIQNKDCKNFKKVCNKKDFTNSINDESRWLVRVKCENIKAVKDKLKDLFDELNYLEEKRNSQDITFTTKVSSEQILRDNIIKLNENILINKIKTFYII